MAMAHAAEHGRCWSRRDYRPASLQRLIGLDPVTEDKPSRHAGARIAHKTRVPEGGSWYLSWRSRLSTPTRATAQPPTPGPRILADVPFCRRSPSAWAPATDDALVTAGDFIWADLPEWWGSRHSERMGNTTSNSS